MSRRVIEKSLGENRNVMCRSVSLPRDAAWTSVDGPNPSTGRGDRQVEPGAFPSLGRAGRSLPGPAGRPIAQARAEVAPSKGRARGARVETPPRRPAP